MKSKLAQRPRFRRPGELRSDLRGDPRPEIAKIVILHSLKDDHIFICTLRPPLEAVRGRVLNLNSEAVRGCVLKSDL